VQLGQQVSGNRDESVILLLPRTVATDRRPTAGDTASVVRMESDV
jgi:hypothetical protein